MNFLELQSATRQANARMIFERTLFRMLYEGRIDDLRSTIQADPTISSLAEQIFSVDPTANKAYAEWIIQMLRHSPSLEEKQKALKTMEKLIPLHINNKNKLPERDKTIQNIRSLEQLEDTVGKYSTENKTKQAYEEPFRANILRNFREGKDSEYIKIFENAEWLVFKPLQYKVAHAFAKAFPRWCTSYGEGSFIAHNGDDGSLIYICAKKFEMSNQTIAFEIMPNTDPEIINVHAWSLDNKNVFAPAVRPYEDAISGSNLPEFVKDALSRFKNKAPMPIPDDVKAQIDQWVAYLGNPPDDNKLDNFLVWAKKVISDRAMGWPTLIYNIDMSSYMQEIAMEFKELERGILSGMPEDRLRNYNDYFEGGVHAQDLQGAGARIEFDRQPSEGIDMYLDAKYDGLLRIYNMHNYPNGSGTMGLLVYYLKGLMNITRNPDPILRIMYQYLPWRIIINQLYRENEKGSMYGPMLWRSLTNALDKYVPGEE